jgi:nucleoside triphosphatase
MAIMMKTRVTVSGIVRNAKGEILLCKMPINRGAYPGQWAIPGGGVDRGEKIRETLARELKEEVGLKVTNLSPASFDDAVREKIYADGHKGKVYMVLLVFDCDALTNVVRLNDEFEAYAWVNLKDLKAYDLNDATEKTFQRKGWL